MSAGFIHLSDIHFGQEKGGAASIHDDIKECVIRDVEQMCKSFANGKAEGVLVTGDIAYSGLAHQYQFAATWLDKIAEAAGCKVYDIQVIPGNHDVDRSTLTKLTRKMLDEIVDQGQVALDGYMSTDADRAMLFNRFEHFMPFAEAYRCPLDQYGRVSEDRVVELSPGRVIRFVRLNSALTSYDKPEEGNLLLGESQHVIKQQSGEEQIVLSHHPLRYFKDKDEALKYVKNRARIFISGHEHDSSITVEKIEDGKDLMLLAAGATIPPKDAAGGKRDYCFNLIEFDWDETTDGLEVKIFPRTWNDDKKMFEAGISGGVIVHKLGCPNFRGTVKPAKAVQVEPETASAETIVILPSAKDEGETESTKMEETYPLLVLRFFRDISYSQRIEILMKLGALPENWSGNLNEAHARSLIDWLIKKGREEEVWTELNSKL